MPPKCLHQEGPSVSGQEDPSVSGIPLATMTMQWLAFREVQRLLGDIDAFIVVQFCPIFKCPTRGVLYGYDPVDHGHSSDSDEAEDDDDDDHDDDETLVLAPSVQ